MKLSSYAKSKGISYQTAWKMWKRGELNASQLPSGTIIVNNSSPISGVAIYSRVSSSENKTNLDAHFCARIYGLRRSKRKTESIIKELEDETS